MIDIDEFATKFAANTEVVAGLARAITPEQAVWRNEIGKWSMLEVLCHLLDEERDDFRMRVDLTLHRPDDPWPPTNPEAWVLERDYAGQDFATVLDAFLAERKASLEWLHGLQDPQWGNVHHHPSHPLTAGDVMLSWLAHDYLHIRQLVKLHYDYIARRYAGLDIHYAGEW